jgi:hypothetical protein
MTDKEPTRSYQETVMLKLGEAYKLRVARRKQAEQAEKSVQYLKDKNVLTAGK